MKFILFHVLLACYLINNSESFTCSVCGTHTGTDLSAYSCTGGSTGTSSTATNCNACMVATRIANDGSTETYRFCLPTIPPGFSNGIVTTNSIPILDNSADPGVSTNVLITNGNTKFNVLLCSYTDCNTGSLSAPSDSNVSKMNVFVLLASLVLGFMKFY